MRVAILSLAVVAVASIIASPASSAPSVASKVAEEFQAGVDAYRLGKYDDARAHLDKALAIDPKLPGPYRFLAAVAKAQRRFPECISAARRALQLNPQSREIAETRKLHDDCRTAAGRPAFRDELGDNAAFAVTANITGATVRIGPLRYGGTPVAPRLIKPGVHELDIEKAGWKTAHVTVEALPGIVTDVEVTLEPVKSP